MIVVVFVAVYPSLLLDLAPSLLLFSPDGPFMCPTARPPVRPSFSSLKKRRRRNAGKEWKKCRQPTTTLCHYQIIMEISLATQRQGHGHGVFFSCGYYYRTTPSPLTLEPCLIRKPTVAEREKPVDAAVLPFRPRASPSLFLINSVSRFRQVLKMSGVLKSWTTDP